MRIDYNQLMIIEAETGKATLDGAVVGSGERTRKESIVDYRRMYPQANYDIRPLGLEWEEADWQDLRFIREWNHPGILWLLCTRDFPAVLKGPVQQLPCWILWGLDVNGYVPDLVFLKGQKCDEVYRMRLGAPERYRPVRVIEGRLYAPRDMKFCLENEHSEWFAFLSTLKGGCAGPEFTAKLFEPDNRET